MCSSDLVLTTRDTCVFQIVGTYDDTSTADLTAEGVYTSSDATVAQFYQAGVLQPLDAGSTTITIHSDALDGHDWGPFDVTVSMVSATAGDLVFNEILADPGTKDDPNQDSVLDPVEDEFLEIAVASDVTVDLSGVTLWDGDNDTPRHTFAEGTILHAGEAIVVFGGGDVSLLSEPYVQFLVANTEIGRAHV